MSQKKVILLLGTIVLFLGIVFTFLVYKINLLSNENSAATAPILYIDGGNGPHALETIEIDLRTQPLVLMDLEGEILAKKVDNKTFVRISSPSGFDTWAYFKDKNSLYLFHRLYQLSHYMNPVTLIELPYDPVSFRELNYGYFRDINGVYYFDSSLLVKQEIGLLPGVVGRPSLAFKKLVGVDLDTAQTLSLVDGLTSQTFSSSLSRKVFMTDKESVYFKATRVADNKNFSLIEWKEQDEIYATNYFQAGGRVFCMNKEQKIEELSADASSFTPLRPYGPTYTISYARDTESFFIDCEVLRDETGNLVDPEHVSFKSLESLYSQHFYHYSPQTKNSSLVDFLIFGGNDIYSSEGTVLVSDVEDFNSFRPIDIGENGRDGAIYFGVDGIVYRMNIHSFKDLYALESDVPVDLETFEALSVEVTKDKNRAYYLSMFGGHFGTFVPKDIASFKRLPCNTSSYYFVDKYHVYDLRSSGEEGFEASVIEGLHPEDLGDYSFNVKAYDELCGGGEG